MAEAKEIVLHIGLHKTGTTSFQEWVYNNREELERRGISLFIPENLPKNHRILALCVLREGVYPQRTDQATVEATRRDVARFLSERRGPRYLFTAEQLSLIRTDEECRALRALFPSEELRFTILLVLRDKEEWFQSYANQVWKATHIEENRTDPRSGFYLDKNGWLTDFDTLISVYRKTFGNVEVFNYSNDTVQQLVDHLLPGHGMNTRQRRMNNSVRFPGLARRMRALLKRLGRVQRNLMTGPQ